MLYSMLVLEIDAKRIRLAQNFAITARPRGTLLSVPKIFSVSKNSVSQGIQGDPYVPVLEKVVIVWLVQ